MAGSNAENFLDARRKMNSKFCVNCGEANLSQASVCRSCGIDWEPTGKNPLEPENEQPKNQEAKPELPQTPPPASRTKAQSSGEIYWVLGGAVAFILFIGGFFVVAVFGTYLYTSRAKAVSTEKYPKPSENPNRNVPVKSNTPDSSSKINPSLITNETMKGIFKVKQKAGKFELVKVIETRSTGYFLTADAEAGALYSDRGKKENVLIDMAAYASKVKAKDEFTEMVKTDKAAGAKILTDIFEDEKTINAIYQLGKVHVLTFCSFRVDSVTFCYRLVSSDRTALIDFHNGFFKS